MDHALFFFIFQISYYVIFVGLHIALMIGLFLEWLREKEALRGAAGDPAGLSSADNELPAVSVIIPVHNESSRLEKLLASLEVQDYPHAEIIFVNDRSRDKSAEMIAAFIQKLSALYGGEGKKPKRSEQPVSWLN